MLNLRAVRKINVLYFYCRPKFFIYSRSYIISVIPKSGGEFAFIYHGLPRGKFPAYLFAFTGATILKTATLGIIAITFGDYALKFLSPEFCQYSDNYETAQKLWAILAIATGAAINIFSIEWTQNSVKEKSKIFF